MKVPAYGDLGVWRLPPSSNFGATGASRVWAPGGDSSKCPTSKLPPSPRVLAYGHPARQVREIPSAANTLFTGVRSNSPIFTDIHPFREKNLREPDRAGRGTGVRPSVPLRAGLRRDRPR